MFLDGFPRFAQAYLGRQSSFPMFSLHVQGFLLRATMLAPKPGRSRSAISSRFDPYGTSACPMPSLGLINHETSYGRERPATPWAKVGDSKVADTGA